MDPSGQLQTPRPATRNVTNRARIVTPRAPATGTCEVCRGPWTAKRSDRKTCGDACRTKLSRIRSAPARPPTAQDLLGHIQALRRAAGQPELEVRAPLQLAAQLEAAGEAAGVQDAAKAHLFLPAALRTLRCRLPAREIRRLRADALLDPRATCVGVAVLPGAEGFVHVVVMLLGVPVEAATLST